MVSIEPVVAAPAGLGDVAGVDVDASFDVLSEFLKRLLWTREVDAWDGLLEGELSFSHFRTLMVLSSRGRAMSLNELSDAVHLSLAATGRNVDKLVGLGMVHRREDVADRRVKRVTLTERADAMLNAHCRRKEDRMRTFLARLPDVLRDDFTTTLQSIVDGDYLHEHEHDLHSEARPETLHTTDTKAIR